MESDPWILLSHSDINQQALAILRYWRRSGEAWLGCRGEKSLKHMKERTRGESWLAGHWKFGRFQLYLAKWVKLLNELRSQERQWKEELSLTLEPDLQPQPVPVLLPFLAELSRIWLQSNPLTQVLSVTNMKISWSVILEMQIKTTMRYYFISIRTARNKTSEGNKHCQGNCRENGILIHC